RFLTAPAPLQSHPLPYTTLFRSGDLGANVFLPAGNYQLEVEILDGGASLGTSPRFDFQCVRLQLTIHKPKVIDPLETAIPDADRSEEHTSELQSLAYLVSRLLLE